MNASLKLLDSVSYAILVPAVLLLALAPFGQTPHLVEKWRMLFAGTLRRPIDVFDFFLRNKRAEWAEYRRQVTPFELARYLPVL